jgi:hypothetical protein
MKYKITKKQIEENIRNISEDKPLTISLALLNEDFKKEYVKKFGEFNKRSKEEIKVFQKIYRQTPKMKAYNRAYQKIWQKKYYKNPEVKARKIAYQKAWRQSEKGKAYYKAYYKVKVLSSEEKTHKKAYDKARYMRKQKTIYKINDK